MFSTLKRMGDYVLVFRHDSSGGLFFNNKEDAKNIGASNQDALFSVLYLLDDLRYKGTYQFKLVYPTLNKTNIWKQTNNFVTGTSGGVTGYEPIDIQVSTQGWGGLEYNTGTTTLADGTVNSSNTYYSIGATVSWGSANTFPGPDAAVSLVELWVYYPTTTQIKEDGVYTAQFNEAGCIKNTFFVRGVSVGSTKPSFTLNNQEMLNSTILAATQGLILVTLNDNFTVKEQIVYDTTTSIARTNFVAKMNSLTTEPFMICSAGVFNSDANMDALMASLKSIEWRNSSYYNQWNYRYSAFGKKNIGITHERNFFNDVNEPLAEFKVSIDDVNDIGTLGFGKAIIQLIQPANNSETFAVDNVSFSAGQMITGSTCARISRAMFLAEQSGLINVNYYTDTTLIGINSIPFGSCEVPEKINFHFVPPMGTNRISISIADDVSTIDYIELRYAGTSLPKGKIQVHENGLSSNSLVISPVSASVYNPIEWKRLHESNSNLLAGTQLSQGENNPVQFGYDVLNSNTNRVYFSGTGDMHGETVKVPVDHTRLYFCSMWAYSIDKEAGNIYLGATAMDAQQLEVPFTKVDGTDDNNMYFQYPDFNTIPRARWVLLYGWLLPSDWTQTQVDAFKPNATYFGVTGNYPEGTNGISPNNNGSSGYKMVKMKPETTHIKLRYLDYYNNGNQSSTMFALPVISNVNVAAFAPDKMYMVDMIDL